jgi:hypothetical protein
VSACSVNIRGPKAAFSEVEKAEDSGLQVTAAFNSSVYRWPGVTWSTAGTYVPGTTTRHAHAEPAHFFESAHGDAYKLSIAATPECRPDPLATLALSKALDDVWESGNALPSKGRVDIYIIDNGAQMSRYSTSISAGRAYRLTYWTPCINGNANAALFYAAMVALHESTHASLDMIGAQSPDAHERERIAVGAEACLYLSLRRSDESLAKENALVLQRFKQATQLGVSSIDLTQLCNAWGSYVREATNRVGRSKGP